MGFLSVLCDGGGADGSGGGTCAEQDEDDEVDVDVDVDEPDVDVDDCVDCICSRSGFVLSLKSHGQL